MSTVKPKIVGKRAEAKKEEAAAQTIADEEQAQLLLLDLNEPKPLEEETVEQQANIQNAVVSDLQEAKQAVDASVTETVTATVKNARKTRVTKKKQDEQKGKALATGTPAPDVLTEMVKLMDQRFQQQNEWLKDILKPPTAEDSYQHRNAAAPNQPQPVIIEQQPVVAAADPNSKFMKSTISNRSRYLEYIPPVHVETTARAGSTTEDVQGDMDYAHHQLLQYKYPEDRKVLFDPPQPAAKRRKTAQYLVPPTGTTSIRF